MKTQGFAAIDRIGFLVERGNVQALDSNAQSLFAVPAGFRSDG